MLRGKLKAQVEEFIESFPHFGTPEGAEGQQMTAALIFLDLNGYDPADCIVFGQRAKRLDKNRYGPVDKDYPIVKVGIHMIDFTARQFSQNAPYPQEWEFP
jgi:hypothetical protein